MILNGSGLGRAPTERPDNPPPGARYESDHISGEGTGPLFENKMTVLSSLDSSGQEVAMPASFASLLAAQAGDTLDACFLTFDLGGASFPGFDYDGVSGGRLSNFTLKNFTGPGITIRNGTTGLLLEGVGLEGLTGNGLTISGGAHHNAINNLRVTNASGHGIHISEADTRNNKIRFGFGTNLPIGSPEGRLENCAGYGVLVNDGAQYNRIQPGTVIGNILGGIRIEGAETDHNLVGINSDVRFRPVNVLKNGGHGVYLGPGVEGTLVRYVTAVGNAGDGFRLEGPDCAHNNLKGLETVPAFEAILPIGDLVDADQNSGHGIHLLNGARDNLPGEESSTNWGFGERSTITHNARSGIVLDGSETTRNTINHLNVGDAVLNNENNELFSPINGEHGIILQNGAHHNTVGDLVALRDIHLTSLPNGAGVMMDRAHFNEVFGCHIGTIHGQPLRPNFGVGPVKWGIVLKNGARGNQIGRIGEDHFLEDPDHIFGGFYSLPYNFIGLATEAGILLDGTNTTSPDAEAIANPNHIINNAIGFGQNGGPAPNKVGIRVTGNAVGHIVGGPLEAMGNRIRGNEDYGIHFLNYEVPLGSSGGGRNFFQWNIIEDTGLEATAVADPLDQLNRGIGVVFENSTRATFGETVNEPNLIRNNFQGVFVESSHQCRIRGTMIDQINHAGVVCRNSTLSEVGGPDASEKNQITRTGQNGASDSAAIAVN